MNYIIVSALEQEFPFDKELNVLYTGVGKINASISLLTYLYNNPHIDTVINVGTAAGIIEKKNQVVSCGTFIEGELDYPSYVLEPIIINPNLYTLATFDSFQTSVPKRKCDFVDMEGYAFAKICKIKKINFFCYKYISDIIGEQNQEETWLYNYQNGRTLLKEMVIKNI